MAKTKKSKLTEDERAALLQGVLDWFGKNEHLFIQNEPTIFERAVKGQSLSFRELMALNNLKKQMPPEMRAITEKVLLSASKRWLGEIPNGEETH